MEGEEAEGEEAEGEEVGGEERRRHCTKVGSSGGSEAQLRKDSSSSLE